jgi:ABC transport permease subunit
MNVFTSTGAALLRRVDDAGFVLDLLVRTFSSLQKLPRRKRFLLDMAFNAGVRALPVTMVVAAFAGAILAMQTGIELKRFGDTGVLGTITALSMCREMGPFITAVILAATVGSSMAAEVGTMKVSDEISALEVMSVDPVNYLVLPRVLALAVMCPTLTALSDLIGIFGGSIIACGGFTSVAKCEAILQRGHADLIAIGKPLIANPDLVERFRLGADLNRWDPKTFYAPGAAGYTDYPAL